MKKKKEGPRFKKKWLLTLPLLGLNPGPDLSIREKIQKALGSMKLKFLTILDINIGNQVSKKIQHHHASSGI